MHRRRSLMPALLAAIASRGAASCGAAPPPTPTVAVAPPPTMTPTATPTATAMATASAAPSSVATAAAPPPKERAKTAAEIMATVPEKAGKISLPNDLTITIDASGRVVIDDPKGKLGGSSSCGPNGFEYRKSVKLFAELQEALRGGARDEIARHVLFPLRVNEGIGKHRMVTDASSLERDFDKVFSPSVVKAILDAEPRAVFCRADGFMLGAGVVWANVKKGRYGVFVINP